MFPVESDSVGQNGRDSVLDEAGSIATALRDHCRTAYVEHNLGEVVVAVGDQMSAMEQYRSALDDVRSVRDERDVAFALCSGTVGILV